jgi:DNA-binding MarR family transcriptional regulator
LMHMDGATRNILAEQLSESMFDVAESCQLKLERTAERLKLTFSEFKLIRAMGGERMLRAGELARRMQLSSSRLTRILDGLVKKGLARREVSPRDRRVVEVTLTPEGEKVQADLQEAWLQAHEEVVELLPAEERESVVLGVTKLSQVAKEWSKR